MNAENAPFSCKNNFWTFCSLFWVFCPFWTTFDPKKTFFGHFWGFLGLNLTQKNGAFFSIHFYRTEMNAENETFFCTERKWTQRTKRSFALNGNEHREQNVLFHWTEMNAENKTFFWKERKWTWEQNVLLKRTDAQPWQIWARIFFLEYLEQFFLLNAIT